MTSAPLGYLSIVLHAHLPFIRHPEVPDFLEEDWYFEGVVETYVPLLRRFEKLRSEHIPFRITMSVTPPLATMMDDALLTQRLGTYIDKRIDLLQHELMNNKGTHVETLAQHYLNEFQQAKDFVFNRCQGHLLNSFRSLRQSGHLEIITCTATHGFLPLMQQGSAQRHQVMSACRAHEHFFGIRPRGIWLAECGYEEGIDQALADAGIEYTFVDSHGILLGDPQPVFGVYAPIITENGISVFARDPESSKQVWSQKEGYPGDPNYREFFRDLGYDAEYSYIKPYLHSDGERRNVGLKYHKITGNVDLGEKHFYDPYWAKEKAAEHAGNFMFNRQLQVRYLKDKTMNPPIIVSPYDAELFGHWWYEGPQFLEFLIRKTHFDQSEIKLMAPVDYIDQFPIRQLQNPNPSTWGSEGHNLVWLNGGNCWMYRHQHWAEKKLQTLTEKHRNPSPVFRTALKQLQRELLLLQSSDWAFILTTGSTVSYATRRFREHLERFNRLAQQIETDSIDQGYLNHLENIDCIFPTIDPIDAVR